MLTKVRERGTKMAPSQSTKTEDGFTIIYNIDDVPIFNDETEEAHFWETHTWSEELLNSTIQENHEPFNLPPRKKDSHDSVTLHLGNQTLERLQDLAERKGITYQTLLKKLIQKGLYEEEVLESTS